MMLGHGFSSILNFYLVGEFYHKLNSRLIYFYKGVFLRSFYFNLFFILVNLISRGLPLTLNFIIEFNGYYKLFNFSLIFILFILFCFMLSFYYSIYFILILIKGKFYNCLEFF